MRQTFHCQELYKLTLYLACLNGRPITRWRSVWLCINKLALMSRTLWTVSVRFALFIKDLFIQLQTDLDTLPRCRCTAISIEVFSLLFIAFDHPKLTCLFTQTEEVQRGSLLDSFIFRKIGFKSSPSNNFLRSLFMKQLNHFALKPLDNSNENNKDFNEDMTIHLNCMSSLDNGPQGFEELSRSST